MMILEGHSLGAALAALLAGYFLGSIPFGLILTRLAGIGDIRQVGSGNIGATNVLRVGSKKLALATLILDGGKGALAVVLVRLYAPEEILLAAMASLLGHIFPCWLRFKGGKGVATAFGILLAYSPPVGLLVCATWLLAAVLFRYSSLSALLATAAGPFYAFFLSPKDGAPQVVFLAAFIAIVVWIRHRDNLRRLLRKEEKKIGQKD